MTHEQFSQLRDELALKVWIMECADVMIPADDARRRWFAMPREGSNRRLELEDMVGKLLIALNERVMDFFKGLGPAG